jgi:hypothetical protein
MIEGITPLKFTNNFSLSQKKLRVKWKRFSIGSFRFTQLAKLIALSIGAKRKNGMISKNAGLKFISRTKGSSFLFLAMSNSHV